MTDRELLEMAAKAAGIERLSFDRVRRDWPWNPLDDDGDALRLAVKLRLIVAWDRWNNNDYACIRHRDLDEEIGLQIDQHPEKTARRAIVMAAAEIGRAM